MERKIIEEEIGVLISHDFNGDIDIIINKLQKYKINKYNRIKIDVGFDSYISEYPVFKIIGFREENDIEFKKRKEKQEKNKIRRKILKQRKQEKEYLKYVKLKEKYEKDGE